MDFRVAVIVVTFQGVDYSARFVDSFKRYTPASVPLIVVDNHSTDGTVEYIQRTIPSAVILRNASNVGFAQGSNQGILEALRRGAWYCMLVNQDIIFSQEWLSPLVDAMEKTPQLGAVQPKILLYPNTDYINSCGNALHYLGFGYTRGYLKKNREWCCNATDSFGYCSGAAVLLNCAALRHVGLFDETFFMYHEDTDLCWRMRSAGWMLSVCPSSVVFHQYEFNRSIKKFYYIERNRLMTLVKNYELKSLLLLAPFHIVWECGMILYSTLSSLHGARGFVLWEKLRGYVYFFHPAHVRELLRARTGVQRIRTVPDRALAHFFTSVIEFQDIDNPVLRYIANPISAWYWALIKRFL